MDAQYGIDKSWVTVGTYKITLYAGKLGEQIVDYTGIPQAASSYTVPDPSDIISSAINNYTTLNTMLSDAVLDSSVGTYYVSQYDTNSTAGDTVQGSMIPVFGKFYGSYAIPSVA